MTVLGKFGVIMADPPWEIHQDLPYGTMADDEMRKMNIGTLQDDGVIFLWVTGTPRPRMAEIVHMPGQNHHILYDGLCNSHVMCDSHMMDCDCHMMVCHCHVMDCGCHSGS